MDAELSGIKPLRKRLGLTQHQLAKAAGVSQSLIAKVEAGLVDPSYTTAKAMLGALNLLERKREPNAEQLLRTRLITCKPDERLATAIAKMEKGALSQLPVLEGDEAVGMLTERAIVKSMARIETGTLVKEVMEEAPPIVPPETPRKVLAELLTHFSLVLVKERGRVKGIVTKADLLRSV